MTKKAILAFSGGLDTSFCAIWLKEQGFEVHTVTVQTDNDSSEIHAVEARALELGVASHLTIDARGELFDDFLSYLIFANALRGEVYPLSVSAERVVQAKRCALRAVEVGADALVHGSTGAGNDQVRFDVAFRVFAPGVEVITPIRSLGLSRDEEAEFLKNHDVEVSSATATYSINKGLWGTTIGGAQTHRSDGVLPEEAYILTRSPQDRPSESAEIEITFEKGVPVALDGEPMGPAELIGALDTKAGAYGVGRGVHVGDTILGIKGRVAFEAPAATVLISAHRELEKLVLSRHQLMWKRTLGDLYGSFLHEARFFDPLMRDIEAFLSSSQRRVSGSVKVRLDSGIATVLGALSPSSLLGRAKAVYGERASLWDGDEAAAFAKIYGLADQLNATAESEGGDTDAAVD